MEESESEDEGYESVYECNRSSRDERSSPAKSCSRVCYFGSNSREPRSSDWTCSDHTVYPCGKLVSKIERNDEVAQASARIVVEFPEYGRLVSKIERNDEVAQVSAPLVVELPEAVIMHILARLPFRSLCRLRTVCRDWNSFIYDRRFARIRSGCVVDELPFCMVYDHTIKGFSSYNPESHVWHRLPVSLFSFSFPYFRVLAASGSLVLLDGSGGDQINLFVVNPINRSERNLPPPLGSGTVLSAHMAIDDMTGHFKILVIMSTTKLFRDFRPARFEVYDSKSHTWEMNGAFPCSIQVSSCVLREDCLYVLAGLVALYQPMRFAFYKVCRDESREGMAIFEKKENVVPKKKFKCLRLSMQGENFMLVGLRRDYVKALRWWRGEGDSLLNGKAENVRWLEVQRLPESLRDWFFSEDDTNACLFSRSRSFNTILTEGNYTWSGDTSSGAKDTFGGSSETIITNVSLGIWCIVSTYPFTGTPIPLHRRNPKMRMPSPYTRFLFRPRWDHFV